MVIPRKAPARACNTEPGQVFQSGHRHSTGERERKSRFEESKLAALRSRLPEYIAAAGVELRGNGNRLIGKCPMHEDSSPSFAVFGSNHETCGCHPCGFTGDVFAL